MGATKEPAGQTAPATSVLSIEIFHFQTLGGETGNGKGLLKKMKLFTES